MAFLLRTEIKINSTPDKIWAIRSDFKNYPSWNPFVTSLTGEVKVGSKINVRLEPPEASVNKFSPTVTAFETNKIFSWLGVFLFRGVFDGEHKFELVDNRDGTTTFVQSENFIGLLVPLFKKTLDNNTRRGYEAMNKKLKELVEQK